MPYIDTYAALDESAEDEQISAMASILSKSTKNKSLLESASKLMTVLYTNGNNKLLSQKAKEKKLTEAITSLTNNVAAVYGVKLDGIFFSHSKNGTTAYYHDATKTVNFNLQDLDPSGVIHTIFHELRHAEQHQKLIPDAKEGSFGHHLKNAAENYYTSDLLKNSVADVHYNANTLEFDAELTAYLITSSLYHELLQYNGKKSKSFISYIKSKQATYSEDRKKAQYKDYKSIDTVRSLSKCEDTLKNISSELSKVFFKNEEMAQDGETKKFSTTARKVIDIESRDSYPSSIKKLSGYRENLITSLKRAVGYPQSDLPFQYKGGIGLVSWEEHYSSILATAYKDISPNELLMRYASDPFLKDYISLIQLHEDEDKNISAMQRDKIRDQKGPSQILFKRQGALADLLSSVPKGVSTFIEKYYDMIKGLESQLQPGQQLKTGQIMNFVVGKMTYNFLDQLNDSNSQADFDKLHELIDSGTIEMADVEKAIEKVLGEDPLTVVGENEQELNSKMRLLKKTGLDKLGIFEPKIQDGNNFEDRINFSRIKNPFAEDQSDANTEPEYTEPYITDMNKQMVAQALESEVSI